MSDIIKAVTDATFDELVIKSAKPVLVDFWAEWCGPCRMLAPYYEKAAKLFADKAACYKYNVDQNPADVAERYGINAVPTVILFRNGKEETRAVGGVKVAKLLNSFAAEVGV